MTGQKKQAVLKRFYFRISPSWSSSRCWCVYRGVQRRELPDPADGGETIDAFQDSVVSRPGKRYPHRFPAAVPLRIHQRRRVPRHGGPGASGSQRGPVFHLQPAAGPGVPHRRGPVPGHPQRDVLYEGRRQRLYGRQDHPAGRCGAGFRLVRPGAPGSQPGPDRRLRHQPRPPDLHRPAAQCPDPGGGDGPGHLLGQKRADRPAGLLHLHPGGGCDPQGAGPEELGRTVLLDENGQVLYGDFGSQALQEYFAAHTGMVFRRQPAPPRAAAGKRAGPPSFCSAPGPSPIQAGPWSPSSRRHS